MTTDTPSLTEDDLDLLRRPLFGILAVAGGPDPAQPRPVWFEATHEGTIQLFTAAESPKVRRLHRDPRASLLVATPVGERERWISITGHVTIHSDGADDLLARLFARYWDDLEDPTRAKEFADMSAGDWVRLVIHPETIRRFAN